MRYKDEYKKDTSSVEFPWLGKTYDFRERKSVKAVGKKLPIFNLEFQYRMMKQQSKNNVLKP